MKKIIGIRKDVYEKLKIFISHYRWQFLGIGMLKLVLVLQGIASIYLFRLLVDDVMINKQLGILVWICLGYLGIYMIETVLIVVKKVLSNKVYKKIVFDIKLRLFRNYLGIPRKMYQTYLAGDLKNRVDTDADVFEAFFDQQIIEYFFNWLSILLYGVVLFYVNWRLALFGFLMVPLSFLMTKTLGGRLRNINNKYRKLWGKYENWLKKSILGWKEVKALAIEDDLSKRFAHYWDDLSVMFFKRRIYWYANRTFIYFKDFFITKMNLFFIGGLLIFNGQITIGSLLVFMKYYNECFNFLGKINELDMQISNDIPSIERVLEFLSFTEQIKKPSLKVKHLKGDIILDDVSFAYSKTGKDAISNINLTINKGEKVAVVGKSGSGKSTLIKCILGLNIPQAGKIKINGIGISYIDVESKYSHIGSVMQDGLLFNMSIKENLILANYNATDEDIKNVCKLTDIHQFIESCPDRYDTVIGEKGIKLSGGQKQKLMMARMLLKKSDIIILDEATSSLDYISEEIIHNTIHQSAQDSTLIIIAHQLSTIKAVDRVIVMDEGRVVGDGTHSDLIGKNPTYDLLFKKQYQEVKVS